MAQLILASASPRRKELLEQIGLRFELFPVDIDEQPLSNELPVCYVERLAKAKAEEAWKQFGLSGGAVCARDYYVLASDTSVIVDQKILGKPVDEAHFYQMMSLLSGREHQVLTSICLLRGRWKDSSSEAEVLQVNCLTVTTNVRFKILSPDEIKAYWRTGEPADKAGGYGIQGKGAVFVERIDGSYSNVVGLPLKETVDLLAEYGISIWS